MVREQTLRERTGPVDKHAFICVKRGVRSVETTYRIDKSRNFVKMPSMLTAG